MIERFIDAAGRWFAFQLQSGDSQSSIFSLVRVFEAKKQKAVLRLLLSNRECLNLRVLKHAQTYLIAEPEGKPEQTVIVTAVSFSWLKRCMNDYQEYPRRGDENVDAYLERVSPVPGIPCAIKKRWTRENYTEFLEEMRAAARKGLKPLRPLKLPKRRDHFDYNTGLRKLLPNVKPASKRPKEFRRFLENEQICREIGSMDFSEGATIEVAKENLISRRVRDAREFKSREQRRFLTPAEIEREPTAEERAEVENGMECEIEAALQKYQTYGFKKEQLVEMHEPLHWFRQVRLRQILSQSGKRGGRGHTKGKNGDGDNTEDNP